MGSIQAPSAPQFLTIGAGSRGHAYARPVDKVTSGVIAAVAEPDAFKREDFGKRYIWKTGQPVPGQAFVGWKEFIQWETQRRSRESSGNGSHSQEPNITGVFICTLDETHVEIICALAPLNLHIMCEKPLALTLSECVSITRSLSLYPPKIFSIGHVLRYSPHNMLLRQLVCDELRIGEIISIEHTEPIGFWHFAHSYVRGNWRRLHPDSDGNMVGSLLTKSCHDIDFILWLLCSPSALTGDRPHLPSTISSHGSVTHFRKARKPLKAGSATNCLSCPAEPDCIYSAKRIYRDKFLRKDKETGWPIKIIVPEMEDIVQTSGWEKGEERLMAALAVDYDTNTMTDAEIASRSWYGRCVYDSDNQVVDDQSVVIAWDEDMDTASSSTSSSSLSSTTFGRGPKQAVFHMTYPTQSQCERRGRIYGTLGEIAYDSKSISVFNFNDHSTTVHDIPEQDKELDKSHGGGDIGLASAFVNAVKAADDGEMGVSEAQWKFVGCDLEECVRSHAAVFAAEEARLGRKVVDWKEWWERRVERVL